MVTLELEARELKLVNKLRERGGKRCCVPEMGGYSSAGSIPAVSKPRKGLSIRLVE